MRAIPNKLFAYCLDKFIVIVTVLSLDFYQHAFFVCINTVEIFMIEFHHPMFSQNYKTSSTYTSNKLALMATPLFTTAIGHNAK
jgi:hypothetical protein